MATIVITETDLVTETQVEFPILIQVFQVLVLLASVLISTNSDPEDLQVSAHLTRLWAEVAQT